jgi:tripeptide aminopeptidase
MDTLLDRFCRYVKVETGAKEDTKDYPSSPGQWDLAKLLAEELTANGVEDVSIDKWAIVTGTIPGTVKAPTIAWFAHMDTSPEYTGKGVKPQIIRKYNGKDIVLPGDKSKVISIEQFPELAELKGKTLITTDGTTLLGADDKSGVAVVMTAAAELLRNKKLKHGPIRVVYTCDEEIGQGCAHVELKKVNATCAYTLDGEGQAEVEGETFSADLATVRVTGVNIHPGYAKGKMVNAVRLAGQFIERLPWHTLAPERTSGREQFMHPYILDGGVPEVRIKILLRSFDAADLKEQAKLLKAVGATVEAEHPGAKISVDVTKQYRNMAEALKKEPRAMDLAAEAVRKAGMEPKFKSIRGGTDGSRLSEMGLPCPNLSTGMHNFHSPLEYACLEEMENAVKVLIELAQLWGKQKR